MKTHKWIIILAVINAIVLFCMAAQSTPSAQPGVQSILRARAIELVDDRGDVRASLSVETNGEAVFRMRDAKGTIRMKLGASEAGSAPLLLDDSTNPGLHVSAKDGRTSMTLINKDGGKRVVEP